FRRLGFAKTAVADIAAELGMSPANVYRFFPSKTAIVQAICQRCLSEVEEAAWAIARSKAPAAQRIEQRVNDIVLVAIEHNWDHIRAHKDALRNVVELILRDGIEAGDFEAVDPRTTAELILRSVVVFTHPLLIGQCLQDGEDVETEARASVRFLLQAITPCS